MFSSSYLVKHLQREARRLAPLYRANRDFVFVDWAVRQIDPALAKDEDKVRDIVRLGGAGEGGVDAIWFNQKEKTLYVLQVKGNEGLLTADVQNLDDEDDLEIGSFNDEAVRDLDAALSKMQSPPPYPTPRFQEVLSKYRQAAADKFKVKLIPAVFGKRQPSFDRAVEDLRARLDGDRVAFRQHSVDPFDLQTFLDRLDENFQTPPGAVQLSTDGWNIASQPNDGIGVWVAFVPVEALIKLRGEHEHSIYHANFRFVLRATPVKKGMVETLGDGKERPLFHLYNNGITILGQHVTVSNQQLRIENPQVINGLQTLETLWEVSHDGRNLGAVKGVRVLTRFIDTSKRDFEVPEDGHPLSERIAEFSNKQNPIFSRDLRSNDKVQKRLQHEIDSMGLNYQRKRGQHKVGTKGVIDNERAAQRCVAFWLKEPAAAKNLRKLLFERTVQDGFYEKIFPENVAAEAILLPHLLYETLPSMSGRDQEVLDHGDFLLLTMMGAVFRRKYGITMGNLGTKRMQPVREALLDSLRDQRINRKISGSWKVLEQSLRRFVDREFARKLKEAKKGNGREPTVRNILFNLRYSIAERKIAPPTTIAKAAARLPAVGDL